MCSYTSSINKNDLNLSGPIELSDRQRLSSVREATRSETVQSESVVIGRSHPDFEKLQTINDKFNSIALKIRKTDKAVLSIEKSVDRMHDEMTTHVKNYPPFLPGSEERAKFLRSFNAFRKQIDSLSFPPKKDQEVVPETGQWKIIINKNGHQKIVHQDDIHIGPKDLDIPEIPENADDNTIQIVIGKIENAQEKLKQAEHDLSRDITEFAQYRGQISQVGELAESDAEPKSLYVRKSLSDAPDISLTEGPSNWINLLDN
jgi:hypothetical protein